MKGCTQLCLTLVDSYWPNTSWAWLIAKAGILTLGSLYFPRLPVSIDEAVASADFVPEHSGGTVPDFNGIPY